MYFLKNEKRKPIDCNITVDKMVYQAFLNESVGNQCEGNDKLKKKLQ